MRAEPKLIQLSAQHWVSVQDFYDALLGALGSPRWHGRNINALIDSMIWGGINEIEPPYRIQIVNGANLNGEICEEILQASKGLLEARAEYFERKGKGIQVVLDFCPDQSMLA